MRQENTSKLNMGVLRRFFEGAEGITPDRSKNASNEAYFDRVFFHYLPVGTFLARSLIDAQLRKFKYAPTVEIMAGLRFACPSGVIAITPQSIDAIISTVG